MIPSSQWGESLFKDAFKVSSTCVFTNSLSDDEKAVAFLDKNRFEKF
jgi:hypothetical protein